MILAVSLDRRGFHELYDDETRCRQDLDELIETAAAFLTTHRGDAKMFVKWSEKYSVGDERLDTQHQRMFEIINTLYSALKTGAARPSELQDVIERLNQYAETHFRAEEDAMRTCGYPELPVHVAEHDRFRREMQRLREHLAGPTQTWGDAARDLLQFLKAWWTSHITGMDCKYIPFLRQGSPPVVP